MTAFLVCVVVLLAVALFAGLAALAYDAAARRNMNGGTR